QGFEIALLALETWAFQLKCMQPEARFCMILACDEDHTVPNQSERGKQQFPQRGYFYGREIQLPVAALAEQLFH
ncbi:hypothetical protein, partial [Gemmiger formicilis]|uniref:hypothetical protein n=1 Tax=Gemmiger formicilis TaxID=745368 RepID=UPI00195EA43D